MASSTSSKHYIPLESDPEVFTDLARQLGVSQDLSFQDIYSLDDADLMAVVPRPVLALILIFPTSAAYEAQKAQEEADITRYEGSGEDEPVVWYRQTIGNACGLYGILHSVSNGSARDFIGQSTPLELLLRQCIPLRPEERAKVLEASQELEAAHRKAALQGQSSVPEDAAAEVDYHYICFVKSRGRLYELDGDKKGPVDRGSLSSDEDVLGEKGVNVIREFIQREKDQNLNFNLMALVSNP
ncbi:MAG: ubiquitinyl hydrolase 1 [Bathelium mastoideum]|nr:MAG: ubiquitinyl hydrolase 1 [Bathelium mastoideum]